MSYHEAFWLATAAAAPVIALAAVVALPDMADATREASNAAQDAVRYSVEARFESSSRAARSQYATLGIVLAQAALLAVSLSALATHRDVMPAWVAIVLAVSGIMLLTVTTLSLIATRGRAALYRGFKRRRARG